MVPKSIEELVKRFKVLASKPKLSKAELKEARGLMLALRQAGMTCNEISELSGGRWSPSSIKFYTPGIKVSHPTQWENAVGLLDKMTSSDLTLEDVEKTLMVNEKLKSCNVSLDNIIDVLFTAESSSLEVADLVCQQEIFKEHGLSPGKLSEALNAREELTVKGFGLDSLMPLLEAVDTYGDAPVVLEAVSTYGSLLNLNDQVEAAKSDLEKSHVTRDDVERQIKEGEGKLVKMDAMINACHKVSELGYDEQVLTDLAELSEKFGGPKAVLQALKAYADYNGIENNILDAKAQLADLKSELCKLTTAHSHLATAINICVKLVNEHNFGIDAIDMLFSVAQKYGGPLEVLKAIEIYGKIESMQERVERLEGNIAGLKQKIDHSEGEYQDTLNKLQSLNALALEVGGSLGKVYCQATDNLYINRLIKLINDPFGADYGNHINVAMVMGISLKNFVTKHEANFKHRNHIKDGLAYLIVDLGGVYEGFG